MLKYFVIATLFLFPLSSSKADEAQGMTVEDRFWTLWLARHPLQALSVNERPTDPAWIPMPEKVFQAELKEIQSALSQPSSSLTTAQQDTLQWIAGVELLRTPIREAHWQFNTVYHWLDVYQSMVAQHDFSGTEGQAYYRSHLAALPRLIRYHENALLQEIKANRVQTCYATKTFLNDLRVRRASGDWETQFLSPLDSPTQQDNANAEAAIAQMDAYIETLSSRYLPACHNAETHGSSLSKQDYATLLTYYTSMNITPEDAIEMGMARVKALQSRLTSLRETQAVQARYPFDNNQALLNAMRHDEKMKFSSSEEAMDATRLYLSRINTRSHRIVTPPNHMETLTATSMPASSGAAAQAYYSAANGRGVLFVNSHHPDALRRYSLPSIIVHESVPGHHYQIQTLKSDNAPALLQHYAFQAQREGWALYMESFTPELTAYGDDEALIFQLGSLSAALLRASRLVIDAKLHTQQWSPEQARAFLSKNTAMSQVSINGSIERFLSLPGQATTYASGVIAIERMVSALKLRFPDASLPQIHDAILTHTAKPIVLVEPDTITLSQK